MQVVPILLLHRRKIPTRYWVAALFDKDGPTFL